MSLTGTNLCAAIQESQWFGLEAGKEKDARPSSCLRFLFGFWFLADGLLMQVDGNFPLFVAAWRGHSAVVSKLLRHPGIDVNKTMPVRIEHSLWNRGHGVPIGLLLV